jgi:heptosyltransferase-2
MKIAIFLPNWLGDLVMATPALRAVRTHFGPDAYIAGVLRPKLAGLLDGVSWLDEQRFFDPHGDQPEHGRLALIRWMRQQRFDCVLLLTNSFHTALLAWLGGGQQRVGYACSGRGPFLTRRVPSQHLGRRRTPSPVVRHYLALAEAIGCPPESPRLELAVTPAEASRGEHVWRSLGLRTDGRVVALNNSGGYGAAKRWPLEHCGTLARRIATELDHDVLVLCGPGEEKNAREIVGLAASNRVFSLADQPLGLGTTKACLQRCRWLVTTDSGPLHVAAALGRPIVSLFGPTSPVWIANPTVTNYIVRVDLECLECAKRTCPLHHHHCMQELSPDRVMETIGMMLRGGDLDAR